MLEEVNLLGRKVIKYLNENEWLQLNPSQNDFAFEFFYNFFKKKHEGLTEFELNGVLLSLCNRGLIEVTLYPSTTQVDVIRGMTLKGSIYYDANKYRLD